MLLALSTGHKIGLAGFAAVFIAFALASALVIPRWRPDFPSSRGRNWFVFATLILFAAMLFAVETFAKEEEGHEPGKAAAEKPGGGETQTGETQTTAQQPQGDAAAGKTVFESQGCASCHTFAAAGANGKIGPNLDEALKGKDASFVLKSIIDPNAEIAQGFPPNVMPQDYGDKLSEKQQADLVAFLTKR